jgi:uncharacterized phage-associated protein
MRIRFNEAKATQAAAYLLKKRGGRMKYIKLIKLLYLADRKSFLERGRTITTDCYVSMEHGPVLSITYNLIGGTHRQTDHTWERAISTVDDFDVKLNNPDARIKLDELSQADIEALDWVFAQYGHWNRWKLIDEIMHKLPEWTDPGDSMSPIDYLDILKAGNISPEDQARIEEELNSLTTVQELLVLPDW